MLDATVAAMAARRRVPAGIAAAIGPCIGFASYEVGPEFPAPVPRRRTPDNARFFRAAPRPRHHLFDLAGYVARRLAAAGVAQIDTTGGDTAREGERFFSCRRTYLAGKA